MDKQTCDGRQYSSEQEDLVWDWCETWLELSALINEVTGTPEPPTHLDAISYWSLRFWLIDHESEFLKIWNDFCRSQKSTLSKLSYIEEISDAEDTDKQFKNPCASFYQPRDLYELAQQLDLQSGTDIWEPSEYRASTMRPILVRIGEIMVNFVDWIIEKQVS